MSREETFIRRMDAAWGCVLCGLPSSSVLDGKISKPDLPEVAYRVVTCSGCQERLCKQEQSARQMVLEAVVLSRSHFEIAKEKFPDMYPGPILRELTIWRDRGLMTSAPQRLELIHQASGETIH